MGQAGGLEEKVRQRDRGGIEADRKGGAASTMIRRRRGAVLRGRGRLGAHVEEGEATLATSRSRRARARRPPAQRGGKVREWRLGCSAASRQWVVGDGASVLVGQNGTVGHVWHSTVQRYYSRYMLNRPDWLLPAWPVWSI